MDLNFDNLLHIFKIYFNLKIKYIQLLMPYGVIVQVYCLESIRGMYYTQIRLWIH